MIESVRFFTLHEIASQFGVSYQMVYNLVKTGVLAAFRFGKSYRVADRDLVAYLQRQRVTAPGVGGGQPGWNPVSVAQRGVGDGSLGEASGEPGGREGLENLPHPEPLDTMTLSIGGFAVYLCAKDRVRFGRNPQRNDFAVVDWRNGKPSEAPTSTVSREQLEICNGGDCIQLFTKKASTRINGVSPALRGKGGLALPSQCRLSMGDISFQLRIHTCTGREATPFCQGCLARRVQSVTLSREDGLPEGFALVWQCCDLGALDSSLVGFRLYRLNGGFVLVTPSGNQLGLADGMRWQDGAHSIEAFHFVQRLIGSATLFPKGE